MNINDLLRRLTKVRPLKPNHWAACCPAHPDKSPSLTLRDAGDRILFHCFSGCTPDAILGAIGLTWRDMFDGDDGYLRATATPPKIKEFDPRDHERLILEIAVADMRAGKTLSIEDRARVQLAYDRIEWE